MKALVIFLLLSCSLRAGPIFFAQNVAAASSNPDIPPVTANLAFLLDAARETGYVDNDPVQTPTDWSGLGNTVTQATLNSRPKYITNYTPTGKPVFYSDATDDSWGWSGSGLSVLRNLGGYTVYAVVNCTNITTGNHYVMSWSTTSASSTRFSIRTESGLWKVYYRCLDADSLNNFGQSSGGPANSTYYVVCARMNFTGPAHELFIDGASVATTTTGTSGTSSNTASAEANLTYSLSSAAMRFGGNIAFCAIYQSVHSSGEVTSMSNWLLSRYKTP